MRRSEIKGGQRQSGLHQTLVMVLNQCTGGRMEVVPSNRDLRQVANTLRRIVELTEHLPEDSPPDAALRDRLELAADVLEGTAKKSPDRLRRT